jgi:hypothetical protein
MEPQHATSVSLHALEHADVLKSDQTGSLSSASALNEIQPCQWPTTAIAANASRLTSDHEDMRQVPKEARSSFNWAASMAFDTASLVGSHFWGALNSGALALASQASTGAQWAQARWAPCILSLAESKAVAADIKSLNQQLRALSVKSSSAMPLYELKQCWLHLQASGGKRQAAKGVTQSLAVLLATCAKEETKITQLLDKLQQLTQTLPSNSYQLSVFTGQKAALEQEIFALTHQMQQTEYDSFSVMRTLMKQLSLGALDDTMGVSRQFPLTQSLCVEFLERLRQHQSVNMQSLHRYCLHEEKFQIDTALHRLMEGAKAQIEYRIFTPSQKQAAEDAHIALTEIGTAIHAWHDSQSQVPFAVYFAEYARLQTALSQIERSLISP